MPDWLRDGSRFGEALDELYIDRHLVQLIELRCSSQQVIADMRSNKASSKISPHFVPEVLDKALRIDQGLSEGSARFLQNHSFLTLKYVPTPETSELVVNNTIHIYSSQDTCYVWNSYRAARLICNSIIVTWGQFFDCGPILAIQAAVKAAQVRLAGLIEEVCESVSFCFLDARTIFNRSDYSFPINFTQPLEVNANRAESLVFVLIIAIMTTGINPSRWLWIKDKLRLIGKSTGSGTLQMLAQIGVDKAASTSSPRHLARQ